MQTCTECSKPVVAGGFCDTHYRRLRRHGHLQQTRPDDWGTKEKHPLYNSWGSFKKRNQGLCQEWREDFWKFVDGIGNRPSPRHLISRISKDEPLGPQNFSWREVQEAPRKNKNYQKEYRKKYPEKAKNTYLRKNYGITLEDYARMFEQQGGVCWICKKIDNHQALSVDHCHTTGKIRGLLCTNCNKVLGHAKDSIEILTRAIEYLKESWNKSSISAK